jgi:endo-1,4-beta-xylanase
VWERPHAREERDVWDQIRFVTPWRRGRPTGPPGGGPRGIPRWLAVPPAALLLVLAVGVSVHARPAMAATTLRQAAEAHGIKLGTALTAGGQLTSNAKYSAAAAREFDAVTPGNEMKWGTVEPTRGQFNWTGADQLVAFAQANNQLVRGHNLVWHSQLPNWLTPGSFTGPQVLQLMQQHIATEAGRFAGKVISWDVVNEPFNEDGSLRSDIFEQATNGPGYIAMALTAAHQADPNAKLYLNDFNIEGINAKSTAMLNLITSLKQQGVPIDAVGLESHFILGQVPSTMQQNIARFAAAGVDVWVTELDDRITLPASSANLTQQASDYSQVVRDCLAVARCVGITVWGFSDVDSWIPGAFPGQGAGDIFDSNIDPKPAYNAMLQALGGTTPTPTPTPTATPTGTPTPTPTPTGGGGVVVTPVVNANGPFFNEDDVRLDSTGSITALTVTIVIQRTTGVSFSGQYNTLGGQVLQSSGSTSSAITYTYTLSSGQTITAGTNRLFGAQASGSGTAHPTAGDTFSVSFTSGGAAGTRSGHF